MGTPAETALQTIGLSRLETLLMEVAGQEILPRYRHAQVRKKPDGSLVTDADLAVQERITLELDRLTPDIPLVGEEMPRERQLAILEEDRFWCLDPLDGTTNFSTGLPYFAISLALVVGGQAILGVVYDPVRKECFKAERGAGAWLNQTALSLGRSPSILGECIAMVDLKRLPRDLLISLAERSPYRSQRNFGAVALEWCWLAAGRCHLYLHGGQKPWDYAAGRLIFAEAGGRILSQGVEPERGMGARPRPAVAAVSDTLFEQWQGWLSETGYHP